MVRMHGRVFVPVYLTRRRVAAGLTLTALSDRAKVSYRNLRRLEDGERPNPQDLTLGRLAAALGCDIDDLTEPANAARPAA